MSSCCSAKEREEILEVIESFGRAVPDAPKLKFRLDDEVISTTVSYLIRSFKDHTETSEWFLASLKIVADEKSMSMLDCAKAIFDPSKVKRSCCADGHCGCGGGRCGCK